MDKKTVFIIITGRVQGVGFRYFALYKAQQTGVTGWVRNTVTGDVEIEASGTQSKLDVFIYWIKTGPPRAIIKSISVAEIPNERSFTNFTIR